MKNHFYHILVLFVGMNFYAQSTDNDTLVNMVRATYTNFDNQQVYEETYLLSLLKEDEVLHNQINWRLKKHSNLTPQQIEELNQKLAEQRTELPLQSTQQSSYSYRIFKSRANQLSYSFEVVEGNDPSIEGASLLQTTLPDVKFKLYKYGIRFTKDIQLNEGLAENSGSLIDFQLMMPFRTWAMTTNENRPDFLKRPERYTYAKEDEWTTNSERYIKVSFSPSHRKASYEGFLIINQTQNVFTEIYASELACPSNACILKDKEARNTYHVLFTLHANGQYLPSQVSITKHCISSFRYNNATKFVAVKNEDSPKTKFKLKGEESSDVTTRSVYTINY